MIGAAWIALAVVVPVLGALLSTASRSSRVVPAATSAATIGVVAALAVQVSATGPVRHHVGDWPPPLGIALRADGLSVVMLGTAGLVFPLVSLAARSQLAPGAPPRRFAALSLLGWASFNALSLSGDAFNLYVTLELLTLVTIGLVIVSGTRAGTAAALKYLLVALLGSLLYLLGVALLYAEVGTLDLELAGARVARGPLASAALAAMSVGLCLKAGVFPLHAWLPPAYVSAKAPATALLSGVIGKAAFVVLVRVWIGIFPAVEPRSAARAFGILAAGGVLWSSMLALRQSRLKRLLTYSSIAHTGYLLLFLPIATPGAYAGSVYMAVAHATASSAMFLAAGTIERAIGRDHVAGLTGVGHCLPLSFVALGIAGTSVMGLPPSGGFVAKWLLARAALARGEWWWAAIVLVSGLLAAGYVIPILRAAFLPLPAGARVSPVRARDELPALALASVSMALGVAPAGLLAFLEIGSAP